MLVEVLLRCTSTLGYYSHFNTYKTLIPHCHISHIYKKGLSGSAFKYDFEFCLKYFVLVVRGAQFGSLWVCLSSYIVYI